MAVLPKRGGLYKYDGYDDGAAKSNAQLTTQILKVIVKNAHALYYYASVFLLGQFQKVVKSHDHQLPEPKWKSSNFSEQRSDIKRRKAANSHT